MWRSPARACAGKCRGEDAKPGRNHRCSGERENGTAWPTFRTCCWTRNQGLRYLFDHDRHRPDHCPLATLDIERGRNAAAADPGSHPVPPLRRPDARRSGRSGRPLWRECVVDRSPGTMPHGRVPRRDFLPCRPAAWRTVADPARRRGAARWPEPMPASASRPWATSPCRECRRPGHSRAPLTACPTAGIVTRMGRDPARGSGRFA